MVLTNENVGPKILAKIKIYVLTRAELLFKVCYEIPCNRVNKSKYSLFTYWMIIHIRLTNTPIMPNCLFWYNFFSLQILKSVHLVCSVSETYHVIQDLGFSFWSTSSKPLDFMYDVYVIYFSVCNSSAKLWGVAHCHCWGIG